jgi:hypothetical protein
MIATGLKLDIRKGRHISAKMKRRLFIPVILGTTRQGRQSENVARSLPASTLTGASRSRLRG